MEPPFNERYQVEVVTLDYYRRVINCQNACPVHTDAGGYVNAIADGEYKKGYIIARQPNPFASTCGRVCFAPCETACRRGQLDAPIAIRALKRFLTERYGVEVAKPPQDWFQAPGPENANTETSIARWAEEGATKKTSDVEAKKVAIIGSGPAGLTAAHDLALRGYAVTIFEALPEPGGMMLVGIPAHRLPREVLDKEIESIKEAGVEIKTNSRVESLDELFNAGYHAILLTLGAHQGTRLGVEGEDEPGVMDAVSFLRRVSLGEEVRLGERVAIIGGGNSAIDAARTALRSGAKQVTIVYRRTQREMPALEEEVEEAMAEGANIEFLAAPTKIMRENGAIKLQCLRMGLGEVDDSGRPRPVPIPGSEFTLRVDTVLAAIGQMPEDVAWSGLDTARGQRIAIDPDAMVTSRPGVFAAGDVVTGPASVIEAVRDGHKAARGIDEYLRRRKGEVMIRGWMTPVDPQDYIREGYLDIPRGRPPLLTVERRIGIAEVEQGYPEERAREQASRCLRCHIQTVFNGDLCILCGGCVDICPKSCYRMVPLGKIEGDAVLEAAIEARYGIALAELQKAGASAQLLKVGTAMIKDETRCTRCGLCAQRCPTGAITMEAFYFEAGRGADT